MSCTFLSQDRQRKLHCIIIPNRYKINYNTYSVFVCLLQSIKLGRALIELSRQSSKRKLFKFQVCEERASSY